VKLTFMLIYWLFQQNICAKTTAHQSFNKLSYILCQFMYYQKLILLLYLKQWNQKNWVL